MKLVGDRKCDICKTTPKEIIDAPIVTGQWAWLCDTCWLRHGAYKELGSGKGQRFKNEILGDKLEG